MRFRREVVTGLETADGAGVRLKRVIGTSALDPLDPFLLLDEFKSEEDGLGGGLQLWVNLPAKDRRVRGHRGKRLMRRRGECVEGSFAHLHDTGGPRRTHLRGHQNIQGRRLVLAVLWLGVCTVVSRVWTAATRFFLTRDSRFTAGSPFEPSLRFGESNDFHHGLFAQLRVLPDDPEP